MNTKAACKKVSTPAWKAGRVVTLQSDTANDPERVEGQLKTQGREARWVVPLQSNNADDPERVGGQVETKGREAEKTKLVTDWTSRSVCVRLLISCQGNRRSDLRL